jgi:plasmid stabilization system protein ParE
VTIRVRLTLDAASDLERLFDFVLKRELRRHDGDLEIAERALPSIEAGLASLSRSPFTCRKASDSPFLRELIIPFGHSGYVAFFEIVDRENVVVAAVRHQREDDYY